MSSLDIPRDPILSSAVQHHFLNVIRQGLVIDSLDVSTTTFERFFVPGGSWAWALKGSQTLADARYGCSIGQDGRDVVE